MRNLKQACSDRMKYNGSYWVGEHKETELDLGNSEFLWKKTKCSRSDGNGGTHHGVINTTAHFK